MWKNKPKCHYNYYIYRKGVCLCVNYKNVNNEITAQDCSIKEFCTKRVTLGIELFLKDFPLELELIRK